MLTENWREWGHGQTLMWRIPNENKTGVYKEIPSIHLIALNISIFLTDFLLYPGADVESVTSKSQFTTTFPKLSAAEEMNLPFRGPTEPCLISLPCPSQCASVGGMCEFMLPLQADSKLEDKRTGLSVSLSWTRPCQLWSCRGDEWIPSSQHCWDPLCAPSVALERGHNLLLSALMVPSVDSGTAGLGFGPARWILPPPYCH